MTANLLLEGAMDPGLYRGPTTPECAECEGRGAVAQSPGTCGKSGSPTYVCPACGGTGRGKA